MTDTTEDRGPMVSIIITTKNNIRTIERCLTSAKEQTHPNTELIVVDNGSTDGTLELARTIADRVYTKGPERCAQRNYGAQEAKGEYLLIHDSDIYFPPTAVEECLALLQQDPMVKAVILPERSIGPGFWSKVKSFERDFYVGNDLIEAARFFDRRVFEEVGGYDETLTACEDWDLQNRIRAAGHKTARSASLLLHDEGRVNVVGSSAKKSYYAPWIAEYRRRHPEIASKQFSVLQRFPPGKMAVRGITHPVLFTSMFIMKGIEWYHGVYKHKA